jgi:hypothetical protein
MKPNLMKTTIFAISFLCLLCATSAFGQNAPVLTNNPQPIQMSEHSEHASQHALASETSLLGSNLYSYAHGEQPLWEFGSSPVYETPLGDVARAYRKEHAAKAKAVKGLEK